MGSFRLAVATMPTSPPGSAVRTTLGTVGVGALGEGVGGGGVVTTRE